MQSATVKASPSAEEDVQTFLRLFGVGALKEVTAKLSAQEAISLSFRNQLSEVEAELRRLKASADATQSRCMSSDATQLRLTEELASTKSALRALEADLTEFRRAANRKIDALELRPSNEKAAFDAIHANMQARFDFFDTYYADKFDEMLKTVNKKFADQMFSIESKFLGIIEHVTKEVLEKVQLNEAWRMKFKFKPEDF